MGVREETLEMLRSGLSPKEISRKRGVSINTTLGYLDQLIGRGDLRRSDILFSVDKSIRDAISKVIKEKETQDPYYICDVLKKKKRRIEIGDIIVVVKYSDAGHALGDMYEDIRLVELDLHQRIRLALEQEYGSGEMSWWRQGVPLQIRTKCQSRREEDGESVSDPYCYTDLLDLWCILDKHWNELKRILPNGLTDDKRILGDKLKRLNSIRRNVMHPVRGVTPSEDDFEFIREFKQLLSEAASPPLLKFFPLSFSRRGGLIGGEVAS